MDQVIMKEESTEQIETEENLYVLPRPKLSLIGILISTFFLRVAFGSTTVLMPIFIFRISRPFTATPLSSSTAKQDMKGGSQ